MDNIQKGLEVAFDEATWRQPAVILLDDLDVLCGAPGGPEFELSGEALYAARVAEGQSRMSPVHVLFVTQRQKTATACMRKTLASLNRKLSIYL